jgi:hypothetical protein
MISHMLLQSPAKISPKALSGLHGDQVLVTKLFDFFVECLLEGLLSLGALTLLNLFEDLATLIILLFISFPAKRRHFCLHC